jgi:putative hydrolase of the HAD superfamily
VTDSSTTAPHNISVVLFDLDDTLFAHRRAVSSGVLAHLRAIGQSISTADAAAELARWHTLEETHYHRYLSGEVDFLAQRRARARDFAEPYGITLADDTAATTGSTPTLLNTSAHGRCTATRSPASKRSRPAASA